MIILTCIYLLMWNTIVVFSCPKKKGNTIDYCELCSAKGTHTLCKYSSSSKYTKISLTDSQKLAILKSHNDFRSDVANGKVEGQPTGSDMLRMRWDTELEYVAGRWAQQGIDEHDKCRDSPRFKVGQNIVWRDPWDMDKALKQWYDEVKDFKPSDASKFAGGASTGHYTQVVWSKTFLVGCYAIDRGAKHSAIRYIMVCNYGPAGNMIGSPLYTQGTPQSACGSNAHADNTYSGLCEINDKVLGKEGITETTSSGFRVWPDQYILPKSGISGASSKYGSPMPLIYIIELVTLLEIVGEFLLRGDFKRASFTF